MNPETPLRQWIEQHLEGRSWNWLARSLAEPVTGTAVRNWADGRYELPPYRADQIAAVFGADPNEVRTAAGLELKDSSDGNAPAITQPAELPAGIDEALIAPGGAVQPLTQAHLLEILADQHRRLAHLEELLERSSDL